MKTAPLNAKGQKSKGALIFERAASKAYWQASQPGPSMAQNFTSVAGAVLVVAVAAGAGAAAWFAETAFNLLLCTVDFSACVALVVRK